MSDNPRPDANICRAQRGRFYRSLLKPKQLYSAVKTSAKDFSSYKIYYVMDTSTHTDIGVTLAERTMHTLKPQHLKHHN